MNKIKTLLMAIVAISALSTNAFAGQFGVGVAGSLLAISADGKEADADASADTSVRAATASDNAYTASVFAEYSLDNGFTVGIEHIPGSAELGKGTRTQTAPVLGGAGEDGSGLITAKAEISDYTTFYAEPTVMLSDRFGVYVKGGASHVTVTPSYTEAADIIQSTYSSQDVWGVMTGVGAKVYSGNFFAKVEYVETEYGTYSFTSTTGDLNTVQADVDTEATRFALGYNF